MKLADPLHETLCAVARVMTATRDSWWIIASAAAVLHGAGPIDVGDVDVLMSRNDARRILPTLGLEARPGPEHPTLRSEILGTWRTQPLPVDFLAGFSVRVADRWHAIEPVTREAVDLCGATVYVPARDELRRIIESFGRPKDLERARLLAALER